MLTVETTLPPTDFSPPRILDEGQQRNHLPGSIMNCETSEEAASTARIPDLDLLEARLQWQLGGRIRDLRVVGQEKGLVIQGHARTYYAKQLAQHAVLEATDMPILANEIEVS